MQESIRIYHNERLVEGLQERLAQLDRIASLAVVSSAVGHDLRHPLTSIRGNVTVLIDDLVRVKAMPLQQPETAKILERMENSVRDIDLGIDQLMLILDTLLKSITSEDCKPEPVDLCKVIQGARAITRSTIGQRARLEVSTPPEPVIVMGSEGKLLQVIVNLLVNAAQSIPEGAPMANRVVLRLSTTPDHLCIEVADTGCGIPEDVAAKIYTPFFTTKAREGSGLGLSICKQIVEEARGTIAMESEVGRGTRFVVKLPREGR
jgi:signal transduction histidine kinase